ncbi:MAG TPA: xanthine dehydrogenase molybdopterin binding subunit, partial [Xanthobacteraceae bacterium]
MPPSDTVLDAPLRHVYRPLPHDSGAKHVRGAAEYIDDIPEPAGTLHIAVGGAPIARGTIRRIDVSEVRNAPGVVAIITADDIPGKNDISPATADEPVFAQTRIDFHSQPVFAVVATTRDAARRAVLRGKIDAEVEKPNVTVKQGRDAGEVVLADYAFINGDVAEALAQAPLRSAGTLQVGGQEHFYLEGQVALA